MSSNILLAGISLLLAGCQYDHLEWRWLGKKAPPAVQAPSGPEAELRANAELLREMFRVVLLRDPVGPIEFSTWFNPLTQGGSLEGLYNGMVHSSSYQHLEQVSSPANDSAIHVFAGEVVELQKELAKPMDLGLSATATIDDYSKAFKGGSLYTLKRVLGDLTLRVIDFKVRGKTPEQAQKDLAEWYSAWVTRLAGRGVDFGIPLRNRSDIQFHRDWALKTTLDRINWEALNRVHRLLNQTQAATRSG